MPGPFARAFFLPPFVPPNRLWLHEVHSPFRVFALVPLDWGWQRLGWIGCREDGAERSPKLSSCALGGFGGSLAPHVG